MPDKRSAFNVRRFGKHEPLDGKRLPLVPPEARPIPLLPLSRFVDKIVYVLKIIASVCIGNQPETPLFDNPTNTSIGGSGVNESPTFNLPTFTTSVA